MNRFAFLLGVAAFLAVGGCDQGESREARIARRWQEFKENTEDTRTLERARVDWEEARKHASEVDAETPTDEADRELLEATKRAVKHHTFDDFLLSDDSAALIHVYVKGKKKRETGTSEAKKLMADITNGVYQYVLENRVLPNSLDDLTKPSKTSNQPYIEKIGLDPWGELFQYRVIDRKRKVFEIWSYGPDKNPDTEDDVRYPPR
jgi:hypothetical protein